MVPPNAKFRIFTAKYDCFMKRWLLTLLCLACWVPALTAQEHRRYALVWNDEFDAGVLNKSVWSKIWRSKADWGVHMSSADTLYAFEDGQLVLRGMVNDFLPNDKAPFLTGGVWSRYRKAFGFGRIEIRAKFDVADGYWPALWMLPQANKELNWPYGGEIDIMEHFRDNPNVNQTVHSNYTYNLKKVNLPSQVAYPAYKEGEYNTYGMERFHDSLVFFVNGKRTFCYPRFHEGVDGQFPFSQHDYYLIMDVQLGYDRSPAVDTAKLPVELRVDYVRYYELDTKTDVIPEPETFQVVRPKKKKIRRVVYDKKTHFDNPDEYRLVVKCGKATVAGNRHWAESTLAQLVDREGRVANLEIHDKAACPHRGISLGNKNLMGDELCRLFDRMAFYKLNYFRWDGWNTLPEEEADRLAEYANDLGISVVVGDLQNPQVGIVELNADPKVPAFNRVFLGAADLQGAWLRLNDLEPASMDALAAFAERYWRGGSAGELKGANDAPDALSEAGSRLANFKEKLAIHHLLYFNK